MSSKFNDNLIRDFNRDGFVILRQFYDLQNEIRPIQAAISKIISLVRHQNGLSTSENVSPDEFDKEYYSLISYDRALGGIVYDAVKQIPAFMRLVASEKHEEIYKKLCGIRHVGVAGGGYGIRIDNPNEEKFRADWHQEYPAQLRSVDGAVFWSPLVKIEQDMGPVRVLVGSHKEGLIPVLTRDPNNPGKEGAYALILSNREERIKKYEEVAPLLNPGDLIVMDFRTIHASGHNTGNRSRWSMQSRLFNFEDTTGCRIGWAGSFAAGKNFEKIHPELVAKT